MLSCTKLQYNHILYLYLCYMYMLHLSPQWARTVLVIERSLPPSTRLRCQATYSHSMADGRKALVLKKVFSVSSMTHIFDATVLDSSPRDVSSPG
jgi:hypothetical protein